MINPEKTHIVGALKYGKPLVSCRFDPTGRYLFAGSEDDTVQRWDLGGKPATEADLAKLKPVAFDGHDGWPFALAFSPDGKTLLTGGTDGRLIRWPASADKPQPISTIPAHRGWVRSIAVSPDGKTVATAGNDRRVRLWSMADGAHLADLPGHERPVYRVGFSKDGKTLISADLKGVVVEWDVRPGKEARRFDASKLHSFNGGQLVDYGGVRDFSISQDGLLLACSGLVDGSNPLGAVNNPAIVVFDMKTGAIKQLQRLKENIIGVAWGVRFHPDGFIISAIGGNAGGHLWFTKPDQAHEFFKLGLPNTARDMDLHPDAVRIATAHHDGFARICAMTA
jgi:WD40 repeat protein